jgi:hypothetical protein
MTDDGHDHEENLCECGGKKYKYVGFKMALDLCYKCGKFDCKTEIKGDDFINFIEHNAELIPHLIESGYLIKA